MDAAGHTTHGQVIEPAWHIRANPSPSSVSRVYGIPELLSAIFLLCVIKNEDGTEHSDWYLNILERQEYPRLSGKEAPLLLAHVCQRWRQTALNIPRLWAHIHIHFNDSVWRESWLEGQLSALQFWMKQSQAAPISVKLTTGGFPDSAALVRGDLVPTARLSLKSTIVLQIIKELFANSHRWENISVNLPTLAVTPFVSCTDKLYPLLKSLAISQVRGDAERWDGMDLSIQCAPRLEELSLQGQIPEDYIVIPNGILPGLRALELSDMTLRLTDRVEGCRIRVLVLCEVILSEDSLTRFPSVFPLLEELTIEVPMPSGDTTIHNDTDRVEFVVLDKLTALRLTLTTGDYFPLYRITAPALRHLCVEDDVDFDDDEEPRHPSRSFEDEIMRLLRRSNASVVSFQYSSNKQISDKITTVLSEMPGLVKLHIENTTFPAAVMEVLKSPSVCPRLATIQNDRILDPRLGVTSDCDNNDILQLVKARCQKRENVLDHTNTQDEGNRSYITELAFPMHDYCERIFLEDEIIQKAEIVWRNTKVSPNSLMLERSF